MSAIIDIYLQAVSERKAISRKSVTPMVNYAILAQLEDDDIPRLISIIRALKKGLVTVSQLDEATELAAAGNKAKWGEAAKP